MNKVKYLIVGALAALVLAVVVGCATTSEAPDHSSDRVILKETASEPIDATADEAAEGASGGAGGSDAEGKSSSGEDDMERMD